MKLSVVRVQSSIPVRVILRARYRRWRQLRKMTPLGRELAKAVDRAETELYLYGRRDDRL